MFVLELSFACLLGASVAAVVEEKDRAAMHIKMHLAFHTRVILNLFGTDPSFLDFCPFFYYFGWCFFIFCSFI